MIKEIRVPSFGERLIGIDSREEPETTQEIIKYKFAEIAELVKKNYESDRDPMKSLMFDHAIGEIISACAAVEKVITYKRYTDENVEGNESSN